jgi:PAS domain S-box-containing protein
MAGVALLIIFSGMAVLAIWRTGSDRDQHAALDRKSHAVADLQEARAQFYYSATLLTLAAISDEPVALINSYTNAIAQGEAALQEAKADFLAGNDAEASAAVEALDTQLSQLRPTLDALIAVGLNSNTAEFVQRLDSEYLPQVWPPASQLLLDLGQLSLEEQAKLSEASANANAEADTSLWLLVMFGVAGFMLTLAVLANLIQSVVGPLASLQRGVRGVASGDMESRAEVSGPLEVASLATDFNTMIVQLNAAAEQMRHRLEVESAVARTSALLAGAGNIDEGLNGALKTLAEAVDAEHAYIFMFKDGLTKMGNTHEWNIAAMSPERGRFADVDCATYAWWVGKLTRNEEVVINDLSQLPPEATPERDLLERMGCKCALAVPFGPGGNPDGFIGFGDKRVSHAWRDEDITLLRMASASIASFISRRRAEQAVRDSEERFRSLSAAAPVGIFLTDKTGGSVYVNERLLSTVGMTLDEALGLGWTSAIHPDDRDRVLREKERANRDSDEFAMDFRIVTPQGDLRWVSAHSRPMGSDGARVGTLEDITERKQAESALRQSEERVRALATSAPVGIFHSDAMGKVVFVNDRFVEIAGESFRDESRNWYEVVHPADRDQVTREVVEAIKRREEFAMEFRLLTPKGATRWVSARAKDMRDAAGRFLGLMGTIEDITQRREGQEALRLSEERFRTLSASAPVGILLASADNVITYTNERLRAILGIDPNHRSEDISYERVLAAFVHPDDQQEVMEAHIQALGRRTYELLREFRIVTRQGETRWVRVHIIPILSAEGAQTGRVGIVEDITEHRMLEEERQNAYERTILLLAIAAEARDPYTEHHLFRIRGYCEAIALQMGLSPDMAKEIGLASLLHDIGKIRVPDAILTKPGPLSEEEWQVMRRHTIWGEELLPASAWFTTARQIARSHHENWDGTGYPDGLKGNQIPLAATIVSVADGFDAMTSKRPYKGAWPPARAMRELRSDQGHKYSPQVLEAFERAVAGGTITRIASARSKLSDLMKAA